VVSESRQALYIVSAGFFTRFIERMFQKMRNNMPKTGEIARKKGAFSQKIFLHLTGKLCILILPGGGMWG
jgi:hypothetical protein